MLDQIYRELEEEGFKIQQTGGIKTGLDFETVEAKVGFRWILLSQPKDPSDGVTLSIHLGDTQAQGKAYLAYLSSAKLDEIKARGWKLEANLHFASAHGKNLWNIRLAKHKEISLEVYLEFWRSALQNGLIRRHERSEFESLLQMLKSGEVMDDNDCQNFRNFFNQNQMQQVNICPGMVLGKSFSRSDFSDSSAGLRSNLVTELKSLFDSFDIPRFSLADYLGGKKMNEQSSPDEKDNKRLNDCVTLLEKHKQQIILQGPPGTGKTFLARNLAEQILTRRVSPNKKEQAQILEKNRCYKLVQFHPSYTYEDFVRGIQVKPDEHGNVPNEVTNRVLANFAQDAHDNPDQPYVLIIDEINRANLSSVLGELIYALEYRDEAVSSMYARRKKREDKPTEEFECHKLVLPKNLYIIGTMNTADRSAGHLDYAIRRRFAFVDVRPEHLGMKNFDGELFKKVQALFTTDEYETRSEHLSEEFRPQDVALGHSYFIVDKDLKDEEVQERMALRLKHDIKPILLEYVKDGVLKESALAEINKLGK